MTSIEVHWHISAVLSRIARRAYHLAPSLRLSMNDTLQSAIFGTLQRDKDLPEYTIYNAEVTIPAHGPVQICLGTWIGNEPDWEIFVRQAEESFPVLLKYESTIRKHAAEQILDIHRDCYQDDWQGTAAELISELRINLLNFSPDGTFELWYAGNDPFHFHDIRIGLNADMHITEVGLDG